MKLKLTIALAVVVSSLFGQTAITLPQTGQNAAVVTNVFGAYLYGPSAVNGVGRLITQVGIAPYMDAYPAPVTKQMVVDFVLTSAQPLVSGTHTVGTVAAYNNYSFKGFLSLINNTSQKIVVSIPLTDINSSLFNIDQGNLIPVQLTGETGYAVLHGQAVVPLQYVQGLYAATLSLVVEIDPFITPPPFNNSFEVGAITGNVIGGNATNADTKVQLAQLVSPGTPAVTAVLGDSVAIYSGLSAP